MSDPPDVELSLREVVQTMGTAAVLTVCLFFVGDWASTRASQPDMGRPVVDASECDLGRLVRASSAVEHLLVMSTDPVEIPTGGLDVSGWTYRPDPIGDLRKQADEIEREDHLIREFRLALGACQEALND